MVARLQLGGRAAGDPEAGLAGGAVNPALGDGVADRLPC